ncbi:MAG TPA: sensor domain-containing diguanylate cyclase [Blastocatellia bacterium]|jgi:diguanylate cyclase (GGDEF)-like protein|nr:sensor domain-containing diguanylate cyclase [Blastocatellia bacterium]
MQMQHETLKTSIFESALRLHESLEAGDVVSKAMELLPGLVEAESWALFLKSDQVERLELVRAINSTAVPVGPMLDLNETSIPVVRAVTERRSIFAASGHDLDQPQGCDDLAVFCVPLLVGNRIVGAVQAARRRAGQSEPNEVFSFEETQAIELVCASLARALANAIDYFNATRQTLVDDLTRLYNVRCLYQTLDNEIRRARRYGSAVSVVFMDLDGFKDVNDAYGHRAGSVTLMEVAEVIAMSVRDSDFVARYGGDEFVLMLPETAARSAVQMAERVRERIATHRFSGGVGADIYLTASFGVASFPEHATEAEKLIELADAAMYEAKQHSKNNVRVAAS